MFETEKATDANDLPHLYREASASRAICACGRKAEDPLHGPIVPEQASSREPAFVTEKGS